MIKDKKYYQAIDLAKASVEIAELGDTRGTHEVFLDAVGALVVLCRSREFSVGEIEQILGKPDRVKVNDAGEVLEYDWSDTYGEVTYTSTTPFQIANGICTGLAPDD